jgi:hypothetical protein
MPDTKLVRAFFALWWALGVVMFLSGVQSAWSAFGPLSSGLDAHALLLGSVEAVAAVLFLVPGVMRVGGYGLLATLGIAFLVHAARGHFSGPLLVYAAGVIFVIVHGPVPARLLRLK